MGPNRLAVTTGHNLSAKDAFVGLLDYGLFSEKLPPCFGAAGLSKHVPATLMPLLTETNERKLERILKGGRHDYVRYEALRDINVPRQMGVPHPESYAIQCLAIRRYWRQIKRHCARAPAPVSRLFVRRTSGKHVFKLNYEGGDKLSNEATDLANMTGAYYAACTDISNCYPSLYTHSIPWALHGRRHSKSNRSLSIAGNVLDRATQGLRDGQTNGLLIGPHTSSVISEIILTRVDRELGNKYTRLRRYIDDYTFYGSSHQEAEQFLHDLRIQLREYELSLNARKTEILPLPLPINKDWVRELNCFAFPNSSIRFGPVRSLLDLSIQLAKPADTYAVLNYAIKMVPPRLTDRARRLFVRETINLALVYPYLAPILDDAVFEKHKYHGMEGLIAEFVRELLKIGMDKLYTDAIAYALYYAIKYDLRIDVSEPFLLQISEVNDCLTNVLLREYSSRNSIRSVQRKITSKARKLRGSDPIEKDRNWLLIYQVWKPATLRSEGQSFLADLKRKGFSFVDF